MPCWAGDRPVSSVACDVHVTAGSGARIGCDSPIAEMRGAYFSSSGVKPTALMMQTLVIQVVSEKDESADRS